jgi:hypothetical protein
MFYYRRFSKSSKKFDLNALGTRLCREKEKAAGKQDLAAGN